MVNDITEAWLLGFCIVVVRLLFEWLVVGFYYRREIIPQNFDFNSI